VSWWAGGNKEAVSFVPWAKQRRHELCAVSYEQKKIKSTLVGWYAEKELIVNGL